MRLTMRRVLPRSGRESVGWWLRSLSLAVVLVTALLGGLVYRFGSIASARAYLRGEVIQIGLIPAEQGSTTSGSVIEKKVTVVFTNNARVPITIIGAVSQCHCLGVGGLPLTIPASAERTATATLSTRRDGDSASEETRQVRFITDSRLTPEVCICFPDSP